MPMWLWVVIIVTIIFLVVDWFIIMGKNPREWKGGKQGTAKQSFSYKNKNKR